MINKYKNHTFIYNESKIKEINYLIYSLYLWLALMAAVLYCNLTITSSHTEGHSLVMVAINDRLIGVIEVQSLVRYLGKALPGFAIFKMSFRINLKIVTLKENYKENGILFIASCHGGKGK